MIVDVHTHAWDYPSCFGPGHHAQSERVRPGVKVDRTIRYADYERTSPPGTKAIVFGGKARLCEIWTPDSYVANYCAEHPDLLIGFMSLDPTQPGWQREMREGREELGLRGIKLLSMYAGFRPDDPMLDEMWQYATDHRLPVMLHTGTTYLSQAPLECTLPRRLDTVAIRFPEVKIILAHLGHPYEGECVAVIRKHPNVYADVSALHYRPFQLYHSLMLVQEYGVWNKVLFGTDFPFTNVNASIDGIRALNNMLEGTALPRLKTDEIEKMIYRDSLPLLGLA
jgi:predicted TIM-barrel fold metal-dependent hydrolase